MYKFLIKPKATQKVFQIYKTEIEGETIEFETDSLEDLAAEYKEIIKTYPTEQVKVIHELDPEILVTIEDTVAINSI